MTMVVNNSGRRLKIGGQVLAPRSFGDVNMPAKDLNNHLFVRSGLIEVSGGKSQERPKKQEQPEPSAEPEDQTSEE